MAWTPLRRPGLLAPAAVALVGGAWALQYALAKLAMNAGAHPLGLAFWEGVGSGVIVLLGQRLTRRARLPLDWRTLGLFAVTGLLGLTLPATAIFWSAQHLPVGIVTMLFALVPMLTYAMALVLHLDRLTGLRFAGLSIGLASVLLLVIPETSLPSRDLAGWVLLALAGAACYAAQAVYVARCAPAAIDPITLGGASLLLGGLFLLPAALAMDVFITPLPPWGPVEAAAAGIVLVNAFCITGYFLLIRHAGPVVASQTSYALTLAGVLWGLWLFDEQHSAWVWAALALLLFGLTMVRAEPAAQPALSSGGRR